MNIMDAITSTIINEVSEAVRLSLNEILSVNMEQCVTAIMNIWPHININEMKWERPHVTSEAEYSVVEQQAEEDCVGGQIQIIMHNWLSEDK